MAFISISITKNHPLILGKGGFGRQLADWLSAEGWGEAEFLDDSAPGCVGGLRDYADPKLLKPGRPAFVALGDNALRVELLQKLAAAGYDTPVFISDMAAVSPIWAWAASSTAGPSWTTTRSWAAACMLPPAAS